MKLTTGVLASAIGCCAHLAAAATGHVYTYDPPTSASSRDVVRSRLDPATARLVLAHRAGVEDYHVETALREDEIEQINALGSKVPLFGGKDRLRKLFILALDNGEGSEVLADKASAIIAIDPAPAAPATKALLGDLEEQYRHDLSPSLDDSTYDYDTYAIAHDLASLEQNFMQYMEEGTWEITALVMPAHEYARTGSGSYQWGTYRMPAGQSPLRKREQPQREKPLSAEPSRTGASVQSDTPLVNYASNDTSPLRGILPACYRSQDECEKSTRSCSGHGKCFKKYHDQDAASGAKGDCYSCACSATKEKTSNGGVRTTHWGGPACQKKDVSMSFWLIALFTVGLVFVVSFAVGQIYSMGSEELPSVIGAGVSGPVKK